MEREIGIPAFPDAKGAEKGNKMQQNKASEAKTVETEAYTVQSDESIVRLRSPFAVSEAIVIASILSHYSLTPVTITSNKSGELGSFFNHRYTPAPDKMPTSHLPEFMTVRILSHDATHPSMREVNQKPYPYPFTK